jgi:hypothetical protein
MLMQKPSSNRDLLPSAKEMTQAYHTPHDNKRGCHVVAPATVGVQESRAERGIENTMIPAFTGIMGGLI